MANPAAFFLIPNWFGGWIHTWRSRCQRHSPIIVGTLLLLGPQAAHAEELWGVTAGDFLINFESSDPSICGRRPITGIASGESVVGIDFRPGPPFMRLYALTDTGHLYLISDPASGIASPVTTNPTLTLQGTAFGFDFDPVTGRLQVLSDADQNIRVNSDTGLLEEIHGNLVYAANDPNAGQDPRVTAAAFSNNTEGSTSTRLYGIDSWLGVLVVQEPLGSGSISTIGPLGESPLPVNGFDISGVTGIAYAALVTGVIFEPSLYEINLNTGEATHLGAIACEAGALRGLSVSNMAVPVEQATWGRIKQRFAR